MQTKPKYQIGNFIVDSGDNIGVITGVFYIHSALHTVANDYSNFEYETFWISYQRYETYSERDLFNRFETKWWTVE